MEKYEKKDIVGQGTYLNIKLIFLMDIYFPFFVFFFLKKYKHLITIVMVLYTWQ